MSEPGGNARSFNELPKAKVRKNWKTYLFWLVPLAAALLAGWFVYNEVFKGGPTLTIFFDNAAGLQPGKSQMKYRGVKIGDVKRVELTKDHRQVKVTVLLDESAGSIAREGSLFWIVKPQVGLEDVRGLRTIVSGDFIAVSPGEGKKQTEFHGLSEPPVEPKEKTLRIVLLSEKLGSQKKRTPVFYRGIQVGEVYNCDLGPSSQTVQISVDIIEHYAPLVRMNSKFWNAGGINLNIGFSGLDISAQSAQTLVSGGIAFATPDTKGKEARSGTLFRLYDKAEDAWLGWAPPIKLPHHHGASGRVPKKEGT